MQSNSLAKLTDATRMLAEVTTIDDAKQLMDIAASAKLYAQKHKLGKEAVDYAKNIEISAEIKLGEILTEMEKNKGSMGIGKSAVDYNDSTQPPTLKELSISRDLSSEAQALASLPDEEQEKVKNGKTSKKTALQAVKEIKREQRREENREKIKLVQSPSEINAKFATIVIDPPWDEKDDGINDVFTRSRPVYSTLTQTELLELPVYSLSDVDCHLYLWVTNLTLPRAFTLIERWGFRYITAITWVKPSFGMGNYFRGQTEHILFCIKGSQPLKRKDIGTVFYAERGKNGHSSKPIEFYNIVESCSPGPFLEMFSRSNRNGWTMWGENG